MEIFFWVSLGISTRNLISTRYANMVGCVCVHGGTTFECLNGVIDIWTIFVQGRLPRVLIFLLSPFSPTSLPQRQLRRDFPVSGKDEDVCGYVNGWSCDAYKIWPNCWFFPYLIYRAAIRLLLDLRSKRSIRRFIIRNYLWKNCQKKFFSRFFSFKILPSLFFRFV